MAKHCTPLHNNATQFISLHLRTRQDISIMTDIISIKAEIAKLYREKAEIQQVRNDYLAECRKLASDIESIDKEINRKYAMLGSIQKRIDLTEQKKN